MRELSPICSGAAFFPVFDFGGLKDWLLGSFLRIGSLEIGSWGGSLGNWFLGDWLLGGSLLYLTHRGREANLSKIDGRQRR